MSGETCDKGPDTAACVDCQVEPGYLCIANVCQDVSNVTTVKIAPADRSSAVSAAVTLTTDSGVDVSVRISLPANSLRSGSLEVKASIVQRPPPAGSSYNGQVFSLTGFVDFTKGPIKLRVPVSSSDVVLYLYLTNTGEWTRADETCRNSSFTFVAQRYSNGFVESNVCHFTDFAMLYPNSSPSKNSYLAAIILCIVVLSAVTAGVCWCYRKPLPPRKTLDDNTEMILRNQGMSLSVDNTPGPYVPIQPAPDAYVPIEAPVQTAQTADAPPAVIVRADAPPAVDAPPAEGVTEPAAETAQV